MSHQMWPSLIYRSVCRLRGHIAVGLIVVVCFHGLALAWHPCITTTKGNSHRQPPPVGTAGKSWRYAAMLPKAAKGAPLGSNYSNAVGLLFIRRLLPLHIGIGLLLYEVLRMCGTVAIAARLLLTAGFHTGVRRFDFHWQTLQRIFDGGSVRIRTVVSWIMSPAL